MTEEQRPAPEQVSKIDVVKKPRHKRWRVIFFSALFLISSMGLLTGCSSDSGGSDTANQQQEAETEADTHDSHDSDEMSDDHDDDHMDHLMVGAAFDGAMWSYTVHGIRESMATGDDSEEKFVIVDLEITNATQESQTFSHANSAYKIEADGSLTFDEVVEDGPELEQTLDDGDIAPGSSIRGEIAFQMHEDASGLMFVVAEESDAIWMLP